MSGQPPDRPGVQQRLDAVPLPVFFLAVAVIGGLAGATVQALTDGAVDIRALVVRVLLFAVVLTWLAARQRRRTAGATPGAGTAVAVAASTRTGMLPADADPAVWRPVLARKRQLAVRGRWLGPAVFGGLAAVSVVLAVLLGSPGWGLIAVGWAALGAVGPLGSARTVRRIDALLDQLDCPTGPG